MQRADLQQPGVPTPAQGFGGQWLYEYQDICPGGAPDHDGQVCAIMEELAADEAGLSRYRVRFLDGVAAEALEPELTRASVRPL